MVKRKQRVRRVWPDEEKCGIVAQALVPGVSVAQVARRYGLNANQVFNWVRDPRFQPDDDAVMQAQFLPVEIIDKPPATRPPDPTTTGSLEITTTTGRHLRIVGSFDPEVVAQLVRRLEA
jgi:transposase